ncbi:hypothetical protein KAU37_08340 [Candidatus Bipolaricaulota bacterium]|nr:hypothetical protein [Candidatus Bipolaricaulota bacterium]
MTRRPTILIMGLSLVGLLLPFLPAYGTNTIGFGVGVPPVLPIAWSESFSFLTTEILAESNLSFLLTLGTYPAYFPNLYQADAALIVKAWLGPLSLYAGGGLSLQWRLIGDAWLLSPFMNVVAGAKLWIVDSFAFCAQVRSLDLLPASWTLDPEVSLGTTIAFGKARPALPRVDEDYLWILVGLGVLALLAYYPRI